MFKKTQIITLVLPLILVSILSLLLSTDAVAVEITTPEGFVFETTTGTIVDYSGAGGNVVIPDTIDGVAVTTIGESAFRDSAVNQITIPISVTNIEHHAFCNTQLTNVSLSDNIIFIGNNAFDTVTMTSFQLPVIGDSDFVYWADSWSNPVANGAVITNFDSEYCAVYEYTVTDADVVVEGGVIDSYYYNGSGYKGVNNPQHLIIPSVLDGQTVISADNHSFSNQDLMDVTLPNTMTSIGDESFFNNDLKEITIPNGVESIGYRAFYDCKLIQVNLPDTLTTIGVEAFAYNNQLSSLIWPSNLEVIGNYAFTYNAFATLSFPDSLVEIGENAFSNNNLISIAFGSGLESIGGSAFFGNNLSAVTLTDNLEYIGSTAFGNEVTTYTLPTKTDLDFKYWVTGEGDKYPNGHTVTNVYTSHTAVYEYILTDADVEVVDGVITSWTHDSTRYSGLGTPKHIIVPQTLDGQTITGIGMSLFQNDVISYIDMPDTVEEIGAFAFNNNLITEINLPSSLITIQDCAFNYSKISTITIPSNVTFIGEYTFANGKLTSVAFPDGLSTMERFAFYRNSITDLELPSGLSVVEYGAFSMNAISSLTIPNSIETIEGNAFSENNLTTVIIPDSVKHIGEQAFRANELTSVTLSNNLALIGDECFSENSLTSISIPNSVFDIGIFAFSNNTLTSFVLPTITHEEYTTWRDSNGGAHNNGDTVNVLNVGYTAEVNYTLTDADVVVTGGEIVSYDFAGSGYFGIEEPARIIIPAVLEGQSVTAIGDQAFRAKALEYVSLAEGMIDIGFESFSGNNVNSISLPNSLINIAESAFDYNLLTELTLPANLETIGEQAFRSNELTAIVIPNKVTFIGQIAFYNNNFTLFNLPTPEGAFLYWIDRYDNQYAGGAEVNVTNTYTAVFENAVTGVTLDLETAEIDANGTVDLTETIAPSDATNKNVTYTSSNTAAAIVDNTGLVTAVAEGTTTITVETEDSGYTDTCEVTIYPNVASVELSAETLQLNVDETSDLNETVLPANARNRNVIYSSDNESAATVDASGIVTAHAVGTATITVTTEDGGYTDSCIITVLAEQTNQKVAIIFGMADYVGTENDLSGPINDMIGLEAVLQEAGYTVFRYMNYGANELLNRVEAVASLIAPDDTLLFAYSGHGADGGYLVGADNYGISLNDLESKLSLHPGVKEVLIDACYSGDFIGKDMDTKSFTPLTSQQDFNDYVISVFSNNDTLLNAKSLAESGYYVITASSGSQYSYEFAFDIPTSPFASENLVPTVINSQTYYWMGYFSIAFQDGFGLYNSTPFSILHSDSNSDDFLTWEELYQYAANATDDRQQAQVYPIDSDHVFYRLDNGTDIPVTGISIEGGQIDIGETLQIIPEIEPVNATNKNVTYTSSNQGVATVSTTGLVTAVSLGTATITVTTEDGGFTDTCTVTSGYLVESVDLSPETAEIELGDNATLTATVSPANATNKNVIYSSSDEAVATVDSIGVVWSHALGTAIITATTEDGSYTDTCLVTVVKSVERVEFSREKYSMVTGDTYQLITQINPSNATNTNVTYSSSDTNVASVDLAGIVTANSTGVAIITVTTEDGGYTDTCEIRVADELITSSIYTVNRVSLYLEDMAIGATVQDIIDAIDNTTGEIHIFDIDMQEITGDIHVSTGYYVQMLIDGDVIDELIIVIEGEVNPDGGLDIIDYTMIRLHILNVSKLKGISLEAADVNDDGIIDVIDYTMVRLHILKVVPLY